VIEDLTRAHKDTFIYILQALMMQMINPWPFSKKGSRQTMDLDKINVIYLQQIIPLYDRKTQEPNDMQQLMNQCNDLFLRKKKQMHSLALFIIYYHQEL
jgi:hypothetical protein